jgi:hypothetical protein
MASVVTPTRSLNLIEAQQQVRSPLHRLRGYIRTYVLLEGAAVVGIFVAMWFWIGVVLDYGVFKVTGLDWAQFLPWGVRAGLLGLVVLALLGTAGWVVLTRLFREFSDAALALVLERRFPRQLGDRLITAVELSDTRQAAAIGYSPAMVRATILDAADRVATLPIKEVFDWKRLIYRGIAVVVLSAGLYLVALAGFITVAMIRFDDSMGGVRELHDAATMTFERDVLLLNSLWPRRAQLELVDFPESGEVRIGRGAGSPTLRFRALKYVIAGAPSATAINAYRDWLNSNKPTWTDEEKAAHLAAFSKEPVDGWRSLTWFDLSPELLQTVPPFPTVSMPDWAPREVTVGLTIDEVEMQLDKVETHKDLKAADHAPLRELVAEVDRAAHNPDLRRKLRTLVIPPTITLSSRGRTTSTRSEPERRADNEYTATFGDLKESISFTARAEDYATFSRRITVVEPPSLDRIISTEERPAYLYYRPGLPEGNGFNPAVAPLDLRGKKQKFAEIEVSLQGGEVAKIDLPAGSDITITAFAGKELQRAGLDSGKDSPGVFASEARPHVRFVIEPAADNKGDVFKVFDGAAGAPAVAPGAMEAGGGAKAVVPAPQVYDLKFLDPHTFQVRFEKLRKKVILPIKFTDTDGVNGEKRVEIAPVEDAPPQLLELSPDEIIRKKDGRYMVAVNARIPFKGKVTDDTGLSDVRYTYTLRRDESGQRGSADRRRLFAFATPVPSGVPLGGGPLVSLAVLAYGLDLDAKLQAEAERAFPPKSQSLPRFQQALREKPQEFLPLARIDALLAQPQKVPFRNLLREFVIQPDRFNNPETDPIGCDFPLWKEKLKVDDPTRPQPRYLMDVRVEAVDNDLDGPLVNGQPRPHVKPSDERFPFVIVSEIELLSEVGTEEDKLADDISKVFAELQTRQEHIRTVVLDLSSPSIKLENLSPMAERCKQTLGTLERGQVATHEVAVAYDRILRELRTNQIDPRLVERIDKIATDLGTADNLFEKCRDDVDGFRKALENNELGLNGQLESARPAGNAAKESLENLVRHIDRIRGAMSKLIDINKIIKQLQEIEAKEQETGRTLEALKKVLIDKLGGDVFTEPKK